MRPIRNHSRRHRPRPVELVLAWGTLLGLGYGTVLALQLPRQDADAIIAEASPDPATTDSGHLAPAPPADVIHASAPAAPPEEESPVPAADSVRHPTRIEEAILWSIETGELPGLRPEIVAALAALERSALAGDTPRMARILARLEERLRDGGEDRDFLLALIARWPHADGTSTVLDAVVKLLHGLGDDAVDRSLILALAERENGLIQERPRDPHSILVRLDTSSDPVEALRTLELLQAEDLELEDVRNRVEEILIGEESTALRARALAALARLGDERSGHLILELESVETDVDLRRALVRALVDWPVPFPEASRRLLDLAGTDPALEVRRFAAMAFEGVETTPSNVRSWLDAFEIETDPSVRFLLVKSAAPHVESRDIGGHLLEILRTSNDPDLRAAAAMSLWKSPLGEVGNALEEAARSDPHPTVRRHAERALRVRRSWTS